MKRFSISLTFGLSLLKFLWLIASHFLSVSCINFCNIFSLQILYLFAWNVILSILYFCCCKWSFKNQWLVSFLASRPSSTDFKRVLIQSVQDHHSAKLHVSVSRSGAGTLKLGIRPRLSRAPLAKDSKVQEHPEWEQTGHLGSVSQNQMEDSERYIFFVPLYCLLSAQYHFSYFFWTSEGTQDSQLIIYFQNFNLTTSLFLTKQSLFP